MPAYNLTIRVPDEDKLSVIISALSGAGTIMNITACNDPTPTQPPPVVKKVRYTGGSRNKGISGRDLIKQLFEQKSTWSFNELEDAFEKAMFSRTSVSPSLSIYRKVGQIKLVAPGIYRWN